MPLISNVRALVSPFTMSQGHIINKELPRVGCDINAFGLSEESNDRCFYSFDREQVQALPALVGAKVVLYGYDSESEITACEAVIETCRSGWRGEPENSFWYCGFRARPIEDTWYNGPIPWLQKDPS